MYLWYTAHPAGGYDQPLYSASCPLRQDALHLCSSTRCTIHYTMAIQWLYMMCDTIYSASCPPADISCPPRQDEAWLYIVGIQLYSYIAPKQEDLRWVYSWHKMAWQRRRTRRNRCCASCAPALSRLQFKWQHTYRYRIKK